MKVLFNHPVRELNIPGPKRVQDLLKELDLLPESILVIRGDDLVTEDDILRDEDCVEIRPVISGGQGKKAPSRRSQGGRVQGKKAPSRGKRPRPGAARAGGYHGKKRPSWRARGGRV